MKTVLLKTLITALFVISCKTDKQNNTKTKAPQEQSEKASAINNNQKSLKSQLDAKKKASKLKTDPTTKKVLKKVLSPL